MIALNIFDPIVIIVLIYTVLITLMSLFNNPYPSSFLILLTIFVVTSYCYYKVNQKEPIIMPVCEITQETTTPYVETIQPTTTMPPMTTMTETTTTTTIPPITTMPPMTTMTTMPPITTMPPMTTPITTTTPPMTTMNITTTPGSITTLPTI